MSIMQCHDCEAYVDTDCGECVWIELGNMRRLHHEVMVCVFCFEKREAEEEARQEQESRAMEEAEKVSE